MWKTKVFAPRGKVTAAKLAECRARMLAWLKRNEGSIQYEEVFIDNACGVTYRKLRWIG